MQGARGITAAARLLQPLPQFPLGPCALISLRHVSTEYLHNEPLPEEDVESHFFPTEYLTVLQKHHGARSCIAPFIDWIGLSPKPHCLFYVNLQHVNAVIGVSMLACLSPQPCKAAIRFFLQEVVD